MKTLEKNGTAGKPLRIFIADTLSAVGGGKTGLTFSTSGLVISTIADVESSGTYYTAAASTIETISTLGTFASPTSGKCRFKEVDSTYFPGIYEIQIADARMAVSSATKLIVMLTGLTNAYASPAEIQLGAIDLTDRSGQYFTPVTRTTDNTSPIYFEWYTLSGSATVTKSLNGASYVSASGTASYLRADGTTYIWQLSYDPADRPASGSVVYQITDGTTTRFLPLLVEPDVPAIKIKTDQLAFTVSGMVDSNIQYVNDILVTGTGAPGNEWGP